MTYSDTGYESADELPYESVPGDRLIHRESVFLERAIADERERLAMACSCEKVCPSGAITKVNGRSFLAQEKCINILLG